MDQIKYHIPYLIMWLISWIIIVIVFIYSYVYFSWLGNKIDKIYSKFENPVSCNLDYSIQDKIEKTYETINSATCTNH